MSSLCEEQHHYSLSHPLFSTKTTLKDINLPPRKLLNRSKLSLDETPPSQTQIINIGSDDYEEESDPYSSDEFRMYEFKIRRCMRSRSHDWTDCPFAHPGEKARRRDPRRFHYSGNPCADFRHGACPHGDSCEFAHGVFECWLHPARYRTHACKDGKNCTRKVCFFAHSPDQLRVLPLSSQTECLSPSSISISSSSLCCSFCHSMASSPTSTLLGLSHLSPPMSPKVSPPISPTTPNKDGYNSLLSRFNEASMSSPNSSATTVKPHLSLSEYLSYKNALLEIMNSLDTLGFEDEPTQFFLSPTSITSQVSTGARDIFNDQDNGEPDLGWVNELVM